MAETNALWPEDPRSGSIIPLRRNAAGKLEWSWPNAIRGAVNDLHELAVAPQRALEGRYTPSELEGVGVRNALTMAGLGLGMPAESNALHMFGGIRAKTANMPALSKALSLEGRGQAPADIHAATGWFRGADNKWRFEIPDSQAAILPGFAKDPGALGGNPNAMINLSGEGRIPSQDFLYHPELFEAYPQLSKVTVEHQLGPGGTGAYHPFDKRIALSPDTAKNMLSTTLHEKQHAVQGIEGFAEGGSPEQFLSPEHHNRQFMLDNDWSYLADKAESHGVSPENVYEGMRRFSIGKPLGETLVDLKKLAAKDPQLTEMFRSHYNSMATLAAEKDAAMEKYRNLAGEAESFLVQDRHATGDHSSFPPSTPGFPPYEKQTVVLNGETQGPMELAPVEHDPFAPQPALIPVDHDPWKHFAEPVTHDPFATEKDATP